MNSEDFDATNNVANGFGFNKGVPCNSITKNYMETINISKLNNETDDYLTL